MMHGMDKLFDIFCKDSYQQRRLEILYQLQMDEHDFAFCSNQKKRRSRAIAKIEKLTSNDVAIKRKSNKFHKLPESTTATASSFTTFDTKSASIESSAILLNKTH